MPTRARTNEQKSFRREQILAAAHTLLTESGYDGFAMAPLARRADVAKGTLYLYFTTREEVLLALCTRYVDQWIEALRPELRAGMTDGDYAEHFFATAYGVENLMCLIARLEQTIEHNVAIDRFIETKRTFHQQIELIAAIPYLKGLIEEELKKNDEAKLSYQKALKIQPEFVDIRVHVPVCFVKFYGVNG